MGPARPPLRLLREMGVFSELTQCHTSRQPQKITISNGSAGESAAHLDAIPRGIVGVDEIANRAGPRLIGQAREFGRRVVGVLNLVPIRIGDTDGILFSTAEGIPVLFSWNFEVISIFKRLRIAAIEKLISVVGIPPTIHDYSDLTELIDHYLITR